MPAKWLPLMEDGIKDTSILLMNKIVLTLLIKFIAADPPYKRHELLSTAPAGTVTFAGDGLGRKNSLTKILSKSANGTAAIKLASSGLVDSTGPTAYIIKNISNEGVCC